MSFQGNFPPTDELPSCPVNLQKPPPGTANSRVLWAPVWLPESSSPSLLS